MDKNTARTISLSLRKEKDKDKVSECIVKSIASSGILSSFDDIGIYYPLGREIDITSLMDYYPKKRFYLPVTREDISFVPYKKGDSLMDAAFHTKEPSGDAVERDSIKCFLIPCVAVGSGNKRIGYGKGYYDRYLKDYKGLKVGIVYDNAVFDVVLDDFDIVLDLVFKG